MRRVGVALVAAVVVVGLASCEPEPTWSRAPTDGEVGVAVIADSLVSQHERRWRSGGLAMGGPLALWARPGTGYPDSGDWVWRLRPHPEVVVLAQGANDAWPFYGGDGWTAADARALDALVTRAATVARCVVLTTLAYPSTAPDAQRRHFDAANAHIRAVARDHPAVHLADWQAAGGHEHWFTADRLHLTAAGAAAHHDVVDAAVTGCGLR